VGVTDDANPAPGNLDGAGFSFSAQALASAGVVPGGTVTSGSLSFTWPDAPAGEPTRSPLTRGDERRKLLAIFETFY
jgi:beta-glucosidase